MDFFKIQEKMLNHGGIEIAPDFQVKLANDFMARGKSFYAVWREDLGLWSTNEFDVATLVDKELFEYAQDMYKIKNVYPRVLSMVSSSTGSWKRYKEILSKMPDTNVQLDDTLTFASTQTKKSDYASKRLPYDISEGDISAYEKIISTLYDPEERAKIEWAIGSVISGDSKNIQKFLVLYGEAGAGKSTILNIIQQLFEGYYTTFDAKALASSNNIFSTEVFRNNPLVAIQHDGDLSRIEDNTKLNSIVSHEEMIMNEKYKSGYTIRLNCFLFMATNRPVKITDAKSGIIRRLIDVKPSGRKLPSSQYFAAIQRIPFELGAIAHHCLSVYQEMGRNYYAAYRPMQMIEQTDVFYNFVESNYTTFSETDTVTLSRAYELYKAYCEESFMEYKMPKYKFREELKNYFDDFKEMTRIDGKQTRSVYSGFKKDKFEYMQMLEKDVEQPPPPSLVIDKPESIFDELAADYPAQYASEQGTPLRKWVNVETTLSDLDTSNLHYVKVPENHIVIDFDLKDENGEKSFEKNLEAASKWPPTYAEFSKSGKGIHLHYIYDGDPSKLSRLYDTDIEVKVFTGDSSLRRMFTLSNGLAIATISSGLPLKGEKPMINFEGVASEKTIREQIMRNLRKEIWPNTAPSVSMIKKILDDAYESGAKYDVSDLRPTILTFANNSSHQSDNCVKMVAQMKFKSEEPSDAGKDNDESPIVFYDVEVFPNLFVVVWMFDGPNDKCIKMINPSPQDVEKLFNYRLIGFNCRRYDNHILYARYLGYDNERLYTLSQRLVSKDNKNAFFGEAYNISYTDVYDFASAANKQSLKKFEIELDLHHLELGLPWDQPVPEHLWEKVADYCCNDVISTKATFHHLSSDWTARQILAKMAGGSYNDTTNSLTTKFIFKGNRNPQSAFNYRNLAEPVKYLPDDMRDFLEKASPSMMAETHGEAKSLLPYFPGYMFDAGKSTYRGEEVGEGGYVYAEPGIYYNVALLDVASMHPHSAIMECLFGVEFTKRFKEIVDGRVSIKHEAWDEVNKMLDGVLTPFIQQVIDGEMTSKDLANALKTAINSVYGLTSAKFDNAFRDPRNKDNIVAKRGALFMIDLKHAVQERGFTVAHIKTDSIKIPNATPEIIKFVMEFGARYGYTFEHEATYEKMCLVNDSVYIARYADSGEWTPTGAQFMHPYVFKTLFSHEPIIFKDMCEIKSVSTALYLDMNENLGDEHDYQFIGKTGSFCPIKPGAGGGLLCREKDGNYYAATGSKGYRWLESETVRTLQKEDDIDLNYFRALVDDAIKAIGEYGDAEHFISSDDVKKLPILDFPFCQAVDDCSKCTHYKVTCEGVPF